MTILGTLNHSNGRDKTARFIQYLCRLMEYLYAKDSTSNKYKFLEYQLSTFRKLLRFGKSLEHFYLASRNVHNEDVLKRLSGLAKVAYGCYLFCDHILLMKRLQLLQLNITVWSTSANKYWLLAIILNLVHNYYQLKKVFCLFNKTNNDVISNLSKSFKKNFPLYLDIIKNVCDMFIPLYALNYIQINSGIIGLLGMVSSLASLITLIINSKKIL